VSLSAIAVVTRPIPMNGDRPGASGGDFLQRLASCGDGNSPRPGRRCSVEEVQGQILPDFKRMQIHRKLNVVTASQFLRLKRWQNS
jgi:hypothetical protein